MPRFTLKIFEFRQASLVCAALAVGSIGCPALAGTKTPIHDFGTSKRDGNLPGTNGTLAVNAAGVVFGTALHGGKGVDEGFGVVFKDIPPASGATAWTHRTLYRFLGNADGYGPFNGVTIGRAGVLYGMTEYGGTNQAGVQGCGTIYQLTPPSGSVTTFTKTTLHVFAVGTPGDGCGPQNSSLLLAKNGSLYGTTVSGGGGGKKGTLFRLDPPARGGTAWTETILYSFAGARDGQGPVGTLSMDSDGYLYGVTAGGGSAGFGTVWQFAPASVVPPAGQKTILYNFTGGTDGAYPEFGVTAPIPGPLTSQLLIYGTTQGGGGAAACSGGCGTLFVLSRISNQSASYTESVAHSFAGGTDGATPAAGVVVRDGQIWGTTQYGGSGSCPSGCGTIFGYVRNISKPNGAMKYESAYDFTGTSSDGSQPATGLAVDKAYKLYGMTLNGGIDNEGTTFEYVP
jgi:uncharacterized repeat protein (TIGR03803 family)